MEIFDKTILPILTYGAGIWGFKYYKVIEKVQIKFLRRQMGLGQSTADVAIYGETGRLPIAIHCHLRCFKFWMKLRDMADERYPKRCYLILKDHDSHGRINLVTDFKNLLMKFKCENLWNEQ